MSVLLLDNNKIGDQGALLLASCVSSMNLSHLNVGFNDIGANGIAALLQACLLPVNSTAMTILNISGSVINADVAKLLADLLVKNRTLNELYLDRTNIGSAGERLIAAGIASNRRCALTSFTGFDLGEVLVTLGSPPALATMANKHALRHLADMWRALEHGEVIVAPNYDCPTAPTTATTSTNCSSSVEGEEDPLRPGKIVLRKPVLESAATPVSLRKLSEDILESDKPPTSVQAPLLSSGTSPSSPSPPANMSDIHKYSAALQRIAFLPFLNADLWSLHQYYFSPVAALGGSPKLDASGCLSSDSEDDPIPCADSRRRSWAEQPKKKQGNRLTMARIAGYPRLKVGNFK